MLVVADKHIPFLQGILEPYFDVQYLEPEQITRTAIKNAEALLIRTRTHCNAELLEGSRVRFIATATIGYDHIDTHYCKAHDIFWTNSPGCNAQGVCDYVEEVLRVLEQRNIISLNAQHQPTLGIVGVGHVGSLVAEMAKNKGYNILLNDPPKGIGVSIEQIARESDIITFHTPLTRSGNYPTWHLCDSVFLEKCKPSVVIINAARGGIVDEAALNSKDFHFIIDTWENEPHINQMLLEKALIGTYHIAGYTLQGKINATNMCLDALCKYFSLPYLHIPAVKIPEQHQLTKGWLLDVDKQLRRNPNKFEILRESYKLR